MFFFVAQILSWITLLLGLYFDLLSLYCFIRAAVNPYFRTSSVPLAGLLLYCMAGCLGFPYRGVLVVLCFLDMLILLAILLVAVGRMVSRRRMPSNQQQISEKSPIIKGNITGQPGNDVLIVRARINTVSLMLKVIVAVFVLAVLMAIMCYKYSRDVIGMQKIGRHVADGLAQDSLVAIGDWAMPRT